MLEFIILAYIFGPVVAIPYGLKFLSPFEIFIALSAIYILPLPIMFKFLEFGGHRRIYRISIFKKFSKITNKSVDNIKETGDDIINAFEGRLGHLGFYLAISIFTILFGIFWATFFSYLLRIREKSAILAISFGVILGNIFWLLILRYSIPMTTSEMLILGLLILLLIYGRKREMDVIRKIGMKLKRDHILENPTESR